MTDFINTVDVVGDEALTLSMIDRTIVEYRDNVVSRVCTYAFHDCENLSNVNLPAVTSVGKYAFRTCQVLSTVDLSSVISIGQDSFRENPNLTALILRTESMCSLEDKYAFEDTPISSGTGYIYVPSSLVDSYKSDSKWSRNANQFRALEDYTVDGTTTGELDPTKI